MRVWSGGLPLVLAALVVSSCGFLKQPGFPNQSFTPRQDIAELESVFGSAGSLKAYYSIKNPEVTDRNKLITGRLVLTDLHYIRFIKSLSATKVQIDTALDLAAIGIGLATTTVGGAAAKTVLGAITTGLAGSRTSISKNVFYEKTVPVLISAMNAARKQALVPILRGIRTRTLAEYPVSQAITDLHAYYYAGTFPGAFEAIQEDSGAKAKNAEDKIQILTRIKGFTTDSLRKQVQALIGKVSGISDADAISLARNPPYRDAVSDAIVSRLVNPKFYEREKSPNAQAARRALRIRIGRGTRSPEILEAWQKALNKGT